MSVINNNLLLTPEGYQISRSVRLRSSASAYFNRATASTGNQRTLTLSAWVKRGAIGASLFTLFGNGAGSVDYIGFNSDSLRVSFAGGTSAVQTTAVYRDSSAWYHVVVAIDTTQATAANRVLVWVNGVAVTSFSTASYPAQNATTSYNTSGTGVLVGQVASGNYFDGYLTEINFIDGQALTPSSFGETDAVTGVWKPKKYAGTYGTNGFYLNFSDNSAATAAAIGKDSSGNGNNWTPNNISVTSGVTYDSMLDVPTMYADGGNGRGNYCVMNPLDVSPTESSGRATITNGNLTVTGGNQFARGWQIPSSGQWYWEITLIDYYNGSPPFIWGEHGVSSGLYGNCTGVQLWADSTGGILQNGTKVQTFSTWANGDVIGFAYDAGTRSMSVYRNGSQLGTAVTADATDKYVYSFLNGTADTSSVAYNFGQRPFAYTPPTGFLALNTQNLPASTITNGAAYMAATTYTGNLTGQSITNTASGASFQPDLVWIKSRSAATDHKLTDSVRGVTKALISNTTGAEITDLTGVTAINSNGFTVGASTVYNNTGVTYVGWQWKESVSAGFDIVTYTGTGSNTTVAHSLGVAPKMIICKHRNAVDNWIVYHASLGGSPDYLWLNLTSAKGTSSAVWNTAPTSSVFGVGTDNLTNLNGGTYVAYLFAEVSGFSKFGSYTGNGSTDGPFVFTNMKPRFVMIKRTDSTSNWYIFDTARDTYNVMKTELLANSTNADADNTRWIDCLSNGFKIRNDNVSQINASGGTFIYAAFAENPFKNSLAR